MLQHEASVGYMVQLKLQALEITHTTTPAGLEDIEDQEFGGLTRFNFPDTSSTSKSAGLSDSEFESRHHLYPVPELA